MTGGNWTLLNITALALAAAGTALLVLAQVLRRADEQACRFANETHQGRTA